MADAVELAVAAQDAEDDVEELDEGDVEDLDDAIMMDDLDEPLVEPPPVAIPVIPDEIPVEILVMPEDEVPQYESDMNDFWDRFPRG